VSAVETWSVGDIRCRVAIEVVCSPVAGLVEVKRSFAAKHNIPESSVWVERQKTPHAFRGAA
jgi:hypothetical protein